MKKALSVLLALTVALSAFAMCFTTVSAETEKQIVIDGNLDVWYLSDEETPSTDLNYYHYTDLESYNRDPSNGHGVAFYEEFETAAEVYMAFDDTYIYVFVKCWDENIAQHPDDTGVSQQSDSIEVWVDPDPNSQTTHPDGTPKTEAEVAGGFPANTQDPEQGDVRFRMRGSDFAVGDMHNIVKPNYGGVSVPDYYRNPENLRGFYFENEEKVTMNGDVLTSGYGLEVRIPRYDVTGGQSCFINVACNNYQGDDQSTWYALAMGKAWWLDYASANEIVWPKEGNPFYDQDVSEKSTWYSESEYNAEGIAVKNGIAELPSKVTALEKAQVENLVAQYNALDDFQKGYVQARNYDALAQAAADLGIEFGEPGDDPGNDPGDDPGDDPKPSEGTMGDINGDDKIDAKDALLVLRIAVGKFEATESETALADVNGDQTVSAKDALEILKFVVEKPSALDKFQ